MCYVKQSYIHHFLTVPTNKQFSANVLALFVKIRLIKQYIVTMSLDGSY